MSLMDIMTIFFYMLVGLGAFIIVIPMIYNYTKRSTAETESEPVLPERLQWQPEEFDLQARQSTSYYAMQRQSVPPVPAAQQFVTKADASDGRLTTSTPERKRATHPGKNWSSHWN